MKESGFQSKIIKSIEADLGFSVNGRYTKNGIPDLINGVLVNGILRFLAVEVKTKDDYERVMSGVILENNRYVVHNIKKLKEHEFLQLHTINKIRDLGGLALVAYNYEQVKEYIKHECGI